MTDTASIKAPRQRRKRKPQATPAAAALVPARDEALGSHYEVTDKCGPRLAGRRVWPGLIVELSTDEATLALAQGAVRSVVASPGERP